jgi:hypothetical protein
MNSAFAIVMQINEEIAEQIMRDTATIWTQEAVYNLRLKRCRERGLHHVQTARYPEPVEWLDRLSRYDNPYTFQGDDYWFIDENLAFEFKMLFG